jgi:hypothetical protein
MGVAIKEISAYPEIDCHSRLALLQAAVEKIGNPESAPFSTRLINLLAASLSDVSHDQNNLRNFLLQMVNYLDAKYFVSLAVGYWWDTKTPIRNRSMIIYVAKYLVNVSPTKHEFFDQLHNLPQMALVDSDEMIAKLLALPVKPPEIMTETTETEEIIITQKMAEDKDEKEPTELGL